MAEDIWNFKTRIDDIFIVTYPKCGTTLTQELMWQITNNVDIDSELSKAIIVARSPWIELSCVMHPNGIDEEILNKPLESLTPQEMMFNNSIKFINEFPSPRIIKTHLPFAMLPPNTLEKAKVLYVARLVDN